MKVKDLLKNLKNNNLYFIDEEGNPDIVEECDDVYDLFYLIELEIYNNYITPDLTEEWKSSVDKTLFILKNDDSRTFLTEFIPLVYNRSDEEYGMYGDEDFIEI